MSRVYNFSAGPSMLPDEVLLRIKDELMDWNNIGQSVMEISHHSPEFYKLRDDIESLFRDLLSIPENYKILLLHGGGRSQFSMVPLNLLGDKTCVNYLETGIWSKLAAAEAQRYCKVNLVASSADQNFKSIPDSKTWNIDTEAAYFYYVDNETVNGTEFATVPEVGNQTLVADMSSNFLSRQIDINRFGLIFASAQKNIGIAGVTVVIVREDLLGNALPITPVMFNYQNHVDAKSLYNTPASFSWYVMYLVLNWIKEQGGVAALETINQRKAKKLYDFIDQSDFYFNDVSKVNRSRMNVPFYLADENLNERFLIEAKRAGIIGVKGHKVVGGMRASLYNAVSEQMVGALIGFMERFEKTVSRL